MEALQERESFASVMYNTRSKEETSLFSFMNSAMDHSESMVGC